MNYVIFAIATIISIVAFWFSVKFISLYFKVKKWNRVQANVTLKELFIHPKYSSSRSPCGIKVNYTYQFNNINYTGNMVYLSDLAGGQTNHMKSTAENKLSQIENTIPIYVNPTDPSQSVMFCEGIGLYSFVFCMAIVALLIGISNIL